MYIATLDGSYSTEEYLAIDAASENRNEYLSGKIMTMDRGRDIDHVRIVDNLTHRFANALDGGAGRTWTSMLRVQASENVYLYPDISVTKDQADFLPTHYETLTNPVVIIEVLDEHTEAIDRGLKFTGCRGSETVQHYVLVSQDKSLIEVFTRRLNGDWDVVSLSGFDAVLELPAIDVAIAVDLIYRNVEFRQS